jgi:hypothetical protein
MTFTWENYFPTDVVGFAPMGGLALGATPLAEGPRHCGQPTWGAAQVPTPDSPATADKLNKYARKMTEHERWSI